MDESICIFGKDDLKILWIGSDQMSVGGIARGYQRHLYVIRLCFLCMAVWLHLRVQLFSFCSPSFPHLVWYFFLFFHITFLNYESINDPGSVLLMGLLQCSSLVSLLHMCWTYQQQDLRARYDSFHLLRVLNDNKYFNKYSPYHLCEMLS